VSTNVNLNKKYVISGDKISLLIDNALTNEYLSKHMMRQHTTGDAQKDDLLFTKFCEYYICCKALYEMASGIESVNEKKYNKESEIYDFIITGIEGKALQGLVKSLELLEEEFRHYNIYFTIS